MIVVYGIGSCDSCRKARKYLDSRAIQYRFHDLRTDGLSLPLVTGWLEQVGADALVNRRSTTWRQLSESDRVRAESTDLPGLLVRHPTLVKRPLLDANGRYLVGFRLDDYDKLLAD